MAPARRCRRASLARLVALGVVLLLTASCGFVLNTGATGATTTTDFAGVAGPGPAVPGQAPAPPIFLTPTTKPGPPAATTTTVPIADIPKYCLTVAALFQSVTVLVSMQVGVPPARYQVYLDRIFILPGIIAAVPPPLNSLLDLIVQGLRSALVGLPADAPAPAVAARVVRYVNSSRGLLTQTQEAVSKICPQLG